MPLYELVMITKDVLRQPKTQKALHHAASHVLQHGGVVQSLEHLGHRTLPYRMKRHQLIHTRGTYLTMAFAASPTCVEGLGRSLGFNEEVIRHSIVKRGEGLVEATGYAAPARPLAPVARTPGTST